MRLLSGTYIRPKILFQRSKMRAKQGSDFVSLFYAKQILPET